MNSTIWRFIIYSEIAAAILLTVGIAQSYGRVVPLTCPRSRSMNISVKSVAYSRPLMVPTIKPRRFSPTTSTRNEGWATWYSRESCRREGTGGKRVLMANGKPLDDTAMACALWITGKHGRPLTPDGRLVKITDVETMHIVVVAWTDNGPGSVPRSSGVICDLTPRGMMALAGEDGIRAGRVAVKVEEI